MFKTILAPTDGSELSEKAVEAAVEFARETRAKIVGVSVARPYPFPPPGDTASISQTTEFEKKMAELAQARVDKVAAVAKAAGVPCETAIAQSIDPYEEIINAAKNFGCDVIFMASHGRKGVNRLFIGSETQKVLAHSSIPVLVFR
jgi:nucleotide-binding universal stress UspA family protein